ncbi:MAG: hypothetical protein CSA65_07640 [Proteobacteria bacterium]|nr:MAG: hypothetical protein CSB49_06750 [Pseudomonadota bacterium]PIE17765.1 MAG: hypothetical protein CSA65_07640 [Pseudomonadota bacterium]
MATLLIAAWALSGCDDEYGERPCTSRCHSKNGWGSGGDGPFGPNDDDGGLPSDDTSPAQVPNCWTFNTQQGAICVACDSAGIEVVSCTTAPPPSTNTCHKLTIGSLSCLVCHDPAGVLQSTRCEGSGSASPPDAGPLEDFGGGASPPDAGPLEDSGGGCGASDAGAKTDLCSCL